MNELISRIEKLNISVFDAVPSQTSVGDRRSLLAVQRAIAKMHAEYIYLEIGSHLGGTIQPYLADDRCKRIYSIDPRPLQQPDDRSSGYIAYYDNNSSEKMLSMLANTGLGDVRKIESIDLDASEVEPSRIMGSPLIAFIDGEHTKKAVLSDFHFCSQIICKDGVVLFHDFFIIYPAILQICNHLSKQNCIYFPVKLEDNVFAIFFDENVLTTDSYLSSIHKRNRHFLFYFRVKTWLRQLLPGPLLTLARRVRSAFRKTTA
jgi:hypothetical protein